MSLEDTLAVMVARGQLDAPGLLAMDAQIVAADLAALCAAEGMEPPALALLPTTGPLTGATAFVKNGYPIIGVDAEFSALPRDQRRGVLAHELQHVISQDLVTSMPWWAGASKLLNHARLRRQEHHADMGGAKMAGAAVALAHNLLGEALRYTSERDQARGRYRIPRLRRVLGEDHPPIHDRARDLIDQVRSNVDPGVITDASSLEQVTLAVFTVPLSVDLRARWPEMRRTAAPSRRAGQVLAIAAADGPGTRPIVEIATRRALKRKEFLELQRRLRAVPLIGTAPDILFASQRSPGLAN